MSPLEKLLERINVHLATIYGEGDYASLTQRLLQAMRLDERFFEPAPFTNHWDQADIAIITYGDSIYRENEVPLQTLHHFLDTHLKEEINVLHILPYFPWTADDGFAVSDYMEVKSELGDWSDIQSLAQDYRLMSDLVINHCSSQHIWFQQFQRGEVPGKNYFVEASPEEDLTQVTRPRTTPLLRPTETKDGTKYVWCTFGHEQVDLNFKNHDLLVELAKIIRYHLDQGISLFRLDAVAFIWKKLGTSCINLFETHELIRLFRTLIEHARPNAVIITETNIPNRENLSYFGNFNEAHGIYNFSLPPLLLNALVTGSCQYLKNWLMSMPPAQHGTMYFNFIASHDGIGLRPAEGLLSEQEINTLVATMRQFGGRVSERSLPDGSRRPYEINISLFDALKGTVAGEDEWGEKRFLCAHTILLSLEGMPAFYLHSLLGTRNDIEKANESGVNRHINRHQWDADALDEILSDPESPHTRILTQLKELIALRKSNSAFHPNGTQFTLHLGDAIFAFWRQSPDHRQNIFCFNNVTAEHQDVPLSSVNLIATEEWIDLITDQDIDLSEGTLRIAPYQCLWLANKRKHLPY